MNDFAKRLARQIRYSEDQRTEAKSLANTESRAFIEQENLKRKLGPDLWCKFRELVVSKCQEVNKELGKEYYRCHDEFPNKLHVIRLSPVANLRLLFNQDGHRIHYESGECVGSYIIGIDNQTGQAILSDPYERTFDLNVEAERLLEECLEKAQF